jgi:hypothetical protein
MMELALEAFWASGGGGLVLFACSCAVLAIIYYSLFGSFFDV